jgi:SAM-dependent methyltransferase
MMQTNGSLDVGIETGGARLPRAGLCLEDASGCEERLLETQRAFDSVAADYDGPRGNNELIQRMRRTLWQVARSEFPIGARLLDLGCGTGLDAVELARTGYRVLATDWSPQMVARTHARALEAGMAANVEVRHLGIHQLDALEDAFDGIYSNFGPLNCVPDMAEVAAECARLLRPRGKAIFSIMGRLCPWEIAHYLRRGRFRRLAVRLRRGLTPVGMNRHTLWARYFFPREFYRSFSDDFRLCRLRALSLFMPPPYLVDVYHRHRERCERLGWLDDRLGGLPLLRGMGDHFLIVLQRR